MIALGGRCVHSALHTMYIYLLFLGHSLPSPSVDASIGTGLFIGTLGSFPPTNNTPLT